MSPRHALELLKQTAQHWSADRCPSMGAALSYYTVFSVAPLLLIVISLAGLFLGQDAARGAIVGEVRDLVGEQGAEVIQTALQSVSQPKEGLLGTLVGVVLLLVGATTVFAELQEDLHRVWKAEDPAKGQGIWGFLRARLLSIGMIMAIGFLLLVSLVASAALSALAEWSTGFFGEWAVTAQVVNFVVGFAMVTTAFALIYRFLPQVRIEWDDVWIGAIVTSLLFSAGKWAIGLYIGKSAVTSAFGAAGSLAVLLVWVYYSAQVFLFGAEFTFVYSHALGSRQGQEAPPPVGAPRLSVLPAAVSPAALAPHPPPAPLLLPAPAPRPRHTMLKLLGSVALGMAAVAAGAHFWRGGRRPVLYSPALRSNHRRRAFAPWPSSRPSSRPIFRWPTSTTATTPTMR